ncbi:hypothetical protein BKA70DRAFT_1235298 [Coprinopsis sp. MPI-PUGE-AT-0042]|nr:hypothetical protein BKA70DRAFT_1235298 [Coprinopsis sp. MPI-PUGE-AT-0042]
MKATQPRIDLPADRGVEPPPFSILPSKLWEMSRVAVLATILIRLRMLTIKVKDIDCKACLCKDGVISNVLGEAAIVVIDEVLGHATDSLYEFLGKDQPRFDKQSGELTTHAGIDSAVIMVSRPKIIPQLVARICSLWVLCRAVSSFGSMNMTGHDVRNPFVNRTARGALPQGTPHVDDQALPDMISAAQPGGFYNRDAAKLDGQQLIKLIEPAGHCQSSLRRVMIDRFFNNIDVYGALKFERARGDTTKSNSLTYCT